MVHLNSQVSGNGVNTVYVAYVRVPTPNDFDAKSSDPRSLDQQVPVPSTTAGTCFILVETSYKSMIINGLPSRQSISLMAETLPFSILGNLPGEVGQGVVSTDLNGAGFREEMKIFIQDGQSTLAQGEIIELKNSMKAIVEWDLSSVELGTYDLLARNIDNQEVTM